MIENKEQLKQYLMMDKFALGKTHKRPKIFGDDIWKFQICLRMYEYYLNTKNNLILLYYYKLKWYKLCIKYNLEIPPNVFGPGLRLNHFGVIVNGDCKVGAWADVGGGVNIGISTDNKTPMIGDCVYIGPGAKLFGGIKIADNIMIGANAVVNKSFEEDSVIIAGIPAKIVSKKYINSKNFVVKRKEQWKNLDNHSSRSNK